MSPLELLMEHERTLLAKIGQDHPQRAYPLLCLDVVPYLTSMGVLAHQKKAGIDLSFALRMVQITEEPVSDMVRRLEDANGIAIPSAVLNDYLVDLARRILETESGVVFCDMSYSAERSHFVVSAHNALADIRNYFNSATGNLQAVR